MPTEEHVTIKIWRTTRKRLRLLRGITQKSAVAILDKLVSEALEKEKELEKQTSK